MVLLLAHTIQLTSLQYTCCALRIPLLPLLTRHSILYMLYMLHKIIYMTAAQILSHRRVTFTLLLLLHTNSASSGSSCCSVLTACCCVENQVEEIQREEQRKGGRVRWLQTLDFLCAKGYMSAENDHGTDTTTIVGLPPLGYHETEVLEDPTGF